MTKSEMKRMLDQKFPLGMTRADIAREFRLSRSSIPVEKLTRSVLFGQQLKRYDVDAICTWVYSGKTLGTYR